MKPQLRTTDRRVFQQRPRRQRWVEALTGLLLLGLGSGLLLALMQLPERLDTVLLVSTAIANLIAGIGRFVQGLLQLLAVLLLVLLAIGALLLLVAGLVRLVRCLLQPRKGQKPIRGLKNASTTERIGGIGQSKRNRR